ncbi:MAG: hypothetical protein COA79_24660 [Planctomycetota bacterium]|nr:MAG: hypothetical protein COA79_24660 [Planctomycetota bacterium]
MSFDEIVNSFKVETDLFITAIALFFIMVPIMLFWHFKKKPTIKTKYSSLKYIKEIKPSLKIRLRNLPFYIRLLTICGMLLAFTHPYLEKEKAPVDLSDKKKEEKKKKNVKDERKKIKLPTEGISIQLVIDRSGSMGVREYRGRKSNYVKFEGTKMSKLEVVKIISQRFITGTKETQTEKRFNGRWSDLIGLFTFARVPLIACPLTLRHDLLLDYISQMEVVTTREENGTYIGYALERAILQIVDAKTKANDKDAYQVKSSIIILITDGKQEIIHDADLNDRHKGLLPSEAAKLAKDNGIKIYSIAIQPTVTFDSLGNARSEDKFDTSEIKLASKITGGMFYSARDGDALSNIYKSIDTLEKSKLPSQKEIEVRVDKKKEIKKKEVEKIHLFQPILWFAFFMFLVEILLTNFYFRRIP